MTSILQRYGADERTLAAAASFPDLYLARVLSQSKELYRIMTEKGECLAEVSGKFRHNATEPAAFPAVGDFVMVGQEENASAVIQRVLPRKSFFERAAVGGEQYAQVVAANIDIAFVCMSLNANYNLNRLERYLAAAWSGGCTPVVVLTKADLCANLSEAMREISSIATGAEVLATSDKDKTSCDRLLEYARPGITASFIGSSGVGKSTLINHLAGTNLITSDIRRDGKGRHATTRRELLVLPGGGIVINTPGMRELGMESADLEKTFADIDDLARRCQFRDCTHTAEPGCAVRRALEKGTLDARRLENYRKLQREARYDGLSDRQREAEKLNAMFADIGGMKNIRRHNRLNNKRNGSVK